MRHRCGLEHEGPTLRAALGALAVVLLLVLPVALPGSGTAVNLDSNGDVAALIRGDPHAKTPPALSEGALLALVAGLAVALVRTLPSTPGAGVAGSGIVATAVADGRTHGRDTGVVGRARRARRGPPAVA